MKHALLIAASVACLFLMSGTASAQKRIVINSEPANAEVFINGQPTNQRTPMFIKSPSGKSFTVSFRKQGYEEGKLLVVKQKQFDGKKAFPAELSYRLTPNAYTQDPTIPERAAREAVSRNNPGATALEQTIIRWAIDSDPQGARVFYRVISSIPAVVKNTNETYLMTTPYEETRSFNILGLTYENSRDVQIEIKVSKNGYETQVKRFNVRQAIDQQEISSFFILVPKEN
ncbi:MAG: PEGA domain-containing protein [Alistipes sp.]|nr:PEGA domain-containing protein [Alistipes sp.]